MLTIPPPPPPPLSLFIFFLFLSISFPSLFKKKSENFGGGFEPPEPPPHLNTPLSSTLKCIAHEICECLTLIINQSKTRGIFPENFKIAKVVPIYKKDDQSQIKNYRPISVLPVISKLFENAMHSQLMEYFTSHKLLSNKQYWI